MIAATLLSVFGMAILGGVHCASMCGGIVGAISQTQESVESTYPIHVYPKKRRYWSWLRSWPHHLGRMVSYASLGAFVASWGLWLLSENFVVSKIMFFLANALLIGMGLQVALQARGYKLPGMHGLETKSLALFKRIQPYITPLMAKCLPADTVFKRFCLGLLWGLLPCGMIYSALALAALSGTPLAGAAIMLALWAGTLPNMVWIEAAWRGPQRLKGFQWARIFVGLVIAGFGVWGMVKLLGIAGVLGRLGLCITR